MFDILTIGEMLIDLTQTGVSDQGIPVYTAFPGGAPANVAVAAAKLGATITYDPNYRASLWDSLGDARLCGTTASLCGIETALSDKDKKALQKALDCDIMLHAYMLTQSGIPVIYSGDEIAQLNDYGYHDIPDKKADSRIPTAFYGYYAIINNEEENYAKTH